LPTASVEAKPIVSSHSLFHLIAIRGQLFPIGLAACGFGSRGLKETVFQGYNPAYTVTQTEPSDQTVTVIKFDINLPLICVLC
jgi:hypothetical protein